MNESESVALTQEWQRTEMDVSSRRRRAGGSAGGRPVVVVLGMHRSGTSLLSNILHMLGVDMADETDQVSAKNAGGFWERPALVAIHDEILEAIGRPIGRPSHLLPFPAGWWRQKKVQALKPRLIAYVREELAKSGNLWGFKDPRTCRLLPLWWEVFRELDLQPLYVHAVRSPAEAGNSMSKKNRLRKLSSAGGELMWLTYNYDVLRYVTLEQPTVLVDYAEWFGDPTAATARLIDGLGIGMDLSDEEALECVSNIVRGEYRHQIEGKDGLSAGFPVAKMLYEAMTAHLPAPTPDQRLLRTQVSLADLLLRSLGPVTADLEAAMEAEAAGGQASEENVRRIAAMEQEASTLTRKLLAARNDLAATAAEISNLREKEASLRRRLDAEADRTSRFGDALRTRDERIAALEKQISRRTVAVPTDPPAFVWPGDGSLSASGGIVSVDRRGIAGRVTFPGRSDISPVVEVRINGRIVTATTCTSPPSDQQDAGWSFLIPWRAIAPEHAGERATVRVAGLDVELGEVDVPRDLLHYQQPPAALAASLFGGSVAAAAVYRDGPAEHDTDDDAALARAYYLNEATKWPQISVIVHGGAGADWETSIGALRGQIHTHWEALCLNGPAHLEALDPRIRVVEAADLGDELAGYGNDALISFLEAGDLIAPTALLQLVVAARSEPEFVLAYTDEDSFDPVSGLRGPPDLKGEWSAELAFSQDYVSRLALVRRSRLPGDLSGGIDAARVYRILMSAVMASGGPVVHVPSVLYHRSIANAAAAPDIQGALSGLVPADGPPAFPSRSVAPWRQVEA